MFNLSKIFLLTHSGKKKLVLLIKDVFDSWLLKGYFFLALGLNLLIWLAVFFIISQSNQNLIILHYSVGFGVDLIGLASQLIEIPILGLIIFLTNLGLVLFLARFDETKFLTHLLLITALAVNLFLLIALGSIYLINFQ